MSSKKDYYSVLGLSAGASKKEVQVAFRSLAKKYHPDVNKDPSSSSKFKELSEAYTVLSDDKQRQIYDQYGHEGLSSSMGSSSSDGFGSNLNDVFGDVFEGIFGSFGGNSRSSHRSSSQDHGENIEIRSMLTLEEVFSGVKKKVKLSRREVCSDCSGNGVESGSSYYNCSRCRGNGKIAFQQGFFSVSKTCPDCSGRGSKPERPCRNCSGVGYVSEQSLVSINFPHGVDKDTILRVPREGHAGRNNVRGDLHVHIDVRAHVRFKRSKNDIHVSEFISIIQATLGCSLSIFSLDGTFDINVPAGTCHGDKLRLKNRGMKVLSGFSRGDLYVHIMLKVPKKLNAEQEDLFMQLADSFEEKVNVSKSSFIRKVFKKR